MTPMCVWLELLLSIPPFCGSCGESRVRGIGMTVVGWPDVERHFYILSFDRVEHQFAKSV